MNISIIPQTPAAEVSYRSSANRSENSKDRQILDIGPDFRLDITGKADISSAKATYGIEFKEKNENTEETGGVEEKGKPDDKNSLLTAKEEIHNQIKMQTISLLQSYMADNPELKDSLGAFFRDNPQALEEISQGKIPEYFNVDNTAKRILDIYFSRFDGGDVQEFVSRAKEIINQAYSEVEGEVGTLPDIVNRTRERVMEILDKFSNGEDVSQFVSIPNIAKSE